ncbi:unnamed protein product, partial [Chrysoparadoxa australica]
GSSIKCNGCDAVGATIRCANKRCTVKYHVPCAEATNWVFSEHPSKAFHCNKHRHCLAALAEGSAPVNSASHEWLSKAERHPCFGGSYVPQLDDRVFYF